MYILLAFVLSIFTINCNAFNVEDIERQVSKLKSELGTSGENGLGTDDRKDGSDVCSEKCTKELNELKKNMTDLYMAFLALQSEFSHLNQHVIFHEKALKHIAVWGHRRSDHNFRSDSVDTDSYNQSSSDDQRNGDLTPDVDSKRVHEHRHHHKHNSHHHHQHSHDHSHHHNHQHSHNRHKISGHPNRNPQNPTIGVVEDGVNEDNRKDKNSSEDSSEEHHLKTSNESIVDESDPNENKSIPLNDSQISPKSGHSSKQLIGEQMKFQSLESEFKRWFDNMLNDIHHNHNGLNEKTSSDSIDGLKAYKRSNDTKDNQIVMDEMETALNSEELLFATCSVRPNRHIALLNQQDIEGTVNMWQISQNRGPLHMHIKLKGFKMLHHEHSHHTGAKSRPVRESHIMPVETEPNEPNQQSGASHSHGFHVHEFGDLSRDCQSLGSHYNPLMLTHGGPYDVVRHVGDLGNIRCDANGEIDAEFTYSQVSLYGEYSIINRSLVIHSNADDYGRNPNSTTSATSGSSGVRIACCVIEGVKQLPKEVDTQSGVGSVAAPADKAGMRSKRRRDTSAPEQHNHYSTGHRDVNAFLRRFAKYESELKYKTLVDFEDRQTRDRYPYEDIED